MAVSPCDRIPRRGSFSVCVGYSSLGLRVPGESATSPQPLGVIARGQRENPLSKRQAAFQLVTSQQDDSRETIALPLLDRRLTARRNAATHIAFRGQTLNTQAGGRIGRRIFIPRIN